MKFDIDDKIYGEIVEYCRLNQIDDVNKFIHKILNISFTTEKWGLVKKTSKKVVESPIIISAETKVEVVQKKVEIKTSENKIDLYGEDSIRKI